MSFYKYVKFVWLFSTCILLVSCSEQADKYYKTFKEAQANHAVEKGLLPAIMPSSAKEIYQTHYIDIPGTRVKFIVDQSGVEEIKSKTKELNKDEFASVEKQFGWLPKWWPEKLSDQDLTLLRYNYDLEYGDGHKEGKVGYFVISSETGQGYYLNN